MTNINLIATPTAQTGAAGTPGMALSGNGALSGAGMNFMDMIFARAQELPGKAENSADTVLKAPVVVHPAFTANTQALTAAQIAAARAVATDSGAQSVTLPDEAGDIPALLADILVALSAEEPEITTAIITEQSGEAAAASITTATPPSVPLDPAAAKALKDAIAALLQGQPQTGDEENNPALIATPLTPAKLAALMDKLKAQVGEAAQQAIAKAPGLVKKTPQDGDITGAESATQAAIALPLAQILRDGEHAAARMNTPIPLPVRGDAAPALDGLNATPQSAQNAANGYTPNAAGKDAATPAQNNAGGSAVNAAAAGEFDALLNSAGWDSIYPDGLEWTQSSGSGTPGLTLTGTAQFTSLVAHAQSATSPHPATQVVAATLTKAAQDGESKSLTLRLDPPELGRIEIRMDFGKEKGMKAHIVMEKPETYMMMQRDAHVLERALQDAGIDAQGGLSFELAQDGHMFDDGHDSPNRHAGGSGGGDEEQTEELIETTMNWYVDAETGMTRYDILA